jgi:UDP-N-acetylglucosamine--dolichyl-phosphate N-acetylglucosaminephosphotransferase
MSSTNPIVISGLTLAGLAVSGALIFNKEGQPLQASTGFSLAAFIVTVLLIPVLKDAFIHAGFSSKDLSKPKRPLLLTPPTSRVRGTNLFRAESMGAVCSFVYIFIMFCFIPFPFYKFLVTETSGAGNRDVEQAVEPNFLENGRTLHLFPHNKVLIAQR